MRVCLIYDCLYPHTVGGAERWYRNLGERLAADGHEVEYLTLRQWDRGVDPDVPGVHVRVVGPRMRLYAGPGRRRILPPLVFGLGVLWHLFRHGRRYDVVHTASFPYFSLLAAGLLRRLGRYRLVVDWHEVWTRRYWREYLGRFTGDIGWLVQRACALFPQHAFCFSRLHAGRLRDEGLRGEMTILPGEYEGPTDPPKRSGWEPLVVFAGRHIPEKRASAIPPAIALARQDIPGLRAVIVGDGPDRSLVQSTVADLALEQDVEIPGFVTSEKVQDLLGRAMCMLLPSRREGYGLIVLEAAFHGTPSIVVADPDNAAAELIDEGENGLIAPSATPQDLAAAILRAYCSRDELGRTTAAWFARNGDRLALATSLKTVVEVYGRSHRLTNRSDATQ